MMKGVHQMKHIRFLFFLAVILALSCVLAAAIGEEAIALTLNNRVNAYTAEEGDLTKFTFTPAESGMYSFCSSGDKNMRGWLYNSNNDQLANDYGHAPDNMNLCTSYYLNAGETYTYEGGVAYGETGAFEFWVQKPDHFVACGDESTVIVDYGSSAEFKVYAYDPNGVLTYEWKQVAPEEMALEDVTGGTLSIDAVTENQEYSVTVRGSQPTDWEILNFRVFYDPQFTVTRLCDSDQTVHPGGSATMSVEGTSLWGNTACSWYYYGKSTDYQYREVEDANGTALTVDDLRESRSYYCSIHLHDDNYNIGFSKQIWFYLNCDNAFSVSAEQNEYSVEPGDSVSLRVDASCAVGDLHFAWYSSPEYYSDERELVEGADDPVLALENVTPSSYYRLYVTDDYQNSWDAQFHVVVENGFQVWSETYDDEICAASDDEITLKAGGRCRDGALSYQWYRSGEPIPGATGPVLVTTDHVTEENTWVGFTCVISDQYGNREKMWYSVYLGEGILVRPVSKSDFVLQPDENAVLKASARSFDGAAMTYEWAFDQSSIFEEECWCVIPGAASTALTVNGQDGTRKYRFLARDGNGNEDCTEFEVDVDSGLVLEGYDSRVPVFPDESVTLQVSASTLCGPIAYQWYKDETLIPGATDASYTVTDAESSIEYACMLRDQYGVKYAWFRTVAGSRFTAQAVGDTDILCREGEEVTLEVEAQNASGQITYQWYRNDQYLDNANESSFSFTAAAGVNHYACEVWDEGEYGGSARIVFYCRTMEIPAMTAGVNTSITVSNGKRAYLSFTPDTTGVYTFTASGTALRNTYLTLFDSDWNEIASRGIANTGSYMRQRLTAGATYYLEYNLTNSNSTTGSVSVVKSSDQYTGAFTLMTGQSFLFSGEDQEFYYTIESAVSSNPSVASVSTKTITAKSPDTTTVTLQYDNGYSAVYTVTVVSRGSVVTVPSGVYVIEEGTFEGDTSLVIVDLGNVNYIGSGAFKNSSVQQVILNSWNVYIAPDAFSGANPVIITRCYEATRYALNHGLEFLYLEEIGGDG